MLTMDNDSISETCEEKIRENPLPAVGIAVVGGIVLSRLPLLGITALLLRVAFTLVRPALLVLGIAKAYDLAKSRGGCCQAGSFGKILD